MWGKPCTGSVLLEVIGDSELVIQWINGQARCDENLQHLEKLVWIIENLHRAWAHGLIQPRLPHLPWCRHVFRELNKEADAMVTLALTTKAAHHHY